jgi:hypothetical protein
MKKSFVVVGAILMFALVAAAQDVPKMETFLGYTYSRMNSASNVPAVSANGGGGQFAYNFNKWIGAVADLGAVHNGNIGGHMVDSTQMSFLFGPRVSLRYSRIRPYFQVLWGGAFMANSTQIDFPAIGLPPIYLPGANQTVTNVANAVSARVGVNQTAFAMTAGGGLDIKINKVMSFRPIGLDYYMTRFQNYRSATDNNQSNLRYTTGLNFTFGAR